MEDRVSTFSSNNLPKNNKRLNQGSFLNYSIQFSTNFLFLISFKINFIDIYFIQHIFKVFNLKNFGRCIHLQNYHQIRILNTCIIPKSFFMHICYPSLPVLHTLQLRNCFISLQISWQLIGFYINSIIQCIVFYVSLILLTTTILRYIHVSLSISHLFKLVSY